MPRSSWAVPAPVGVSILLTDRLTLITRLPRVSDCNYCQCFVPSLRRLTFACCDVIRYTFHFPSKAGFLSYPPLYPFPLTSSVLTCVVKCSHLAKIALGDFLSFSHSLFLTLTDTFSFHFVDSLFILKRFRNHRKSPQGQYGFLKAIFPLFTVLNG